MSLTASINHFPSSSILDRSSQQIYKGSCEDSSTIDGFDEGASQMEMVRRTTNI
jgi:hypothetical protein